MYPYRHHPICATLRGMQICLSVYRWLWPRCMLYSCVYKDYDASAIVLTSYPLVLSIAAVYSHYSISMWLSHNLEIMWATLHRPSMPFLRSVLMWLRVVSLLTVYLVCGTFHHWLLSSLTVARLRNQQNYSRFAMEWATIAMRDELTIQHTLLSWRHFSN